MHLDTIVAISTPLGQGAIGIVRMSGELSLTIAQKLLQRKSKLDSHRAVIGIIKDPIEQSPVDQALVLYMRSPKSYTGEDMIEFHCHGSLLVLKKVLELCLNEGARLAEEGEFSKRAFLNGKLDLTQAEAILDLIHSQTQPGMQQAVYQLEGHLSQPIQDNRQELLNLLVAIEANIDFPHEVDPIPDQEIIQTIKGVAGIIQSLLETAETGKIWRQGIRVAIVGQPNVGKSSLLNQLLRYDRAIVTEVPGTTRDTVEDEYNLHGIPLKLVDTAGLRKTDDRVESIGIERSLKAVDEAQLVLLVIDNQEGLKNEDFQILDRVGNKTCVIVGNKQDLSKNRPVGLSGESHPFVLVSALNNTGIAQLESTIHDLIIKGKTHYYNHITINDRHRICLTRAHQALTQVLQAVDDGLPGDFLTIDIKEAIAALGEVVGEAVSEEVLHEMFHQFCIGK